MSTSSPGCSSFLASRRSFTISRRSSYSVCRRSHFRTSRVLNACSTLRRRQCFWRSSRRSSSSSHCWSRLDSSGPALFRSERIGAGGQRIRVMKFRTMRERADDELHALLEDDQARAEFQRTHKLRNDPRVTRTGSWLRSTSLDELPQLYDVLRGRLSLVGPRPITIAEYEQFVRGREGNGSWTGVSGYWDIPGLRPGLTGLWQINGRSAIAYGERVRLDKIYLSNWSFRLDLLILAKTVRALAVRAGAS